MKGYSADLSVPESIPALLAKIGEEMGFIDVAVYNACTASVDYLSDVDTVAKHTKVNVTSLHVTFATLLPLWKEKGKILYLYIILYMLLLSKISSL